MLKTSRYSYLVVNLNFASLNVYETHCVLTYFIAFIFFILINRCDGRREYKVITPI